MGSNDRKSSDTRDQQKEHFREICESVSFLHKKFFSDVYFRSVLQERPLSVVVNRMADRIRIRLEETSFLHLKAVRICVEEESGATYFLDSDVSVSTSSVFKSSVLDVESLFRFDNAENAFHTDEEKGWLLVSFPRSRVRSIEISNRDDAYADRAWSLAVDVADGSDEWNTIYRHRERESLFTGLVRQMTPVIEDKALNDEVISVALECLRNPFSVTNALKHFRKIYGVGLEQKLYDPLNRIYLDGLQLEITGHGAKKTFRYYTPAEKRTYLMHARDICRVISATHPLNFLNYGCLLGYVRGGDFIAHDDDLDITVLVDCANEAGLREAMDTVLTNLLDAGYTLIEAFSYNFHVAPPLAPSYDIFFSRCDGEKAVFRPANVSEISITDIIPLNTIEIHGSPMNIPRNYIAVLEAIYGPSWRQPDPLFAHENW